MIFLFPRWDMLVPWRVFGCLGILCLFVSAVREVFVFRWEVFVYPVGFPQTFRLLKCQSSPRISTTRKSTAALGVQDMTSKSYKQWHNQMHDLLKFHAALTNEVWDLYVCAQIKKVWSYVTQKKKIMGPSSVRLIHKMLTSSNSIFVFLEL